MNQNTKHHRKGLQSLRQAEEVGLIGSRVWTQPKIEVLLCEYKKRKFLYNMRHVNYRNKFARQEALDDIAKILCKIRPRTTGFEVKLKFNILRTQYYVELSKEKKNAVAGKPHVTKLWFMDHIKFVRGHNRLAIYGQREKEGPDLQNSEPLLQVQHEDQASLSQDYFIENNDKYEDYADGDTENNEDPLSNKKTRAVSLMIKTEKLIEETKSEMTSDSPDEKEDEDDRSNSAIIRPATSTLLNQKRTGRKVQGSENLVGKITEPNDYSAEETLARYSEEDLFGQIVSKKLKEITNPRKCADPEFKIFSILHSALVEELQDS